LAGCGFRPLYGNPSTQSDGITANNQLAMIKIDPIANRAGQILHNALRNDLNPYGQPLDPAYRLDVKLEEAVAETFRLANNTSVRNTLTLRARYTLTDSQDNVLLRDGGRASVSYDVLQDPYSDIATAEDARARAAEQLAQVIKGRLAVYFTQH